MKERGYVHIQIHNHGFIVLHIYIYLYTSTFCMAYLQFQRGTKIHGPGFVNSNEMCYHI